SRHYAFEGRCFVLAVGVIMPAADIPKGLRLAPGIKKTDLLLRGGSAIIAPDASYMAKPVFDREELVVAEIDLAATDREKMTLDVTGHSARPDVFDFAVRPIRRAAAR